MRRRRFITLAGWRDFIAWPFASRTQQAAMPLVGFLDPRPPDGMTERVRAFRQGLKDAGYIEGQNFAIEYRWAEGRYDRGAGSGAGSPACGCHRDPGQHRRHARGQGGDGDNSHCLHHWCRPGEKLAWLPSLNQAGRQKLMQRALIWLVSVVVLAWTVSAHAALPSLKGTYAFTGTLGCLFAPGSDSAPPNPPGTMLPNAGFRPNLVPFDVPSSFSISNSIVGVRRFNGDGTGTVSATEVGIVMRPTPGSTGYPSFPPDASSAQIQYSFTYTFNPNGTFATSLSGPLSGTFLAGPRSGQTFSIPDLPQFLGVPSQDFSTIVLAEPAPMVETVTYSNGDVWPRICLRSRVLIRIGQ